MRNEDVGFDLVCANHQCRPEQPRRRARYKPTTPRLQNGGELKTVFHMLLVLAVVLFVLWLLFHASVALINLLWIAIVILAVLWLIGLLRGRRTTY